MSAFLNSGGKLVRRAGGAFTVQSYMEKIVNKLRNRNGYQYSLRWVRDFLSRHSDHLLIVTMGNGVQRMPWLLSCRPKSMRYVLNVQAMAEDKWIADQDREMFRQVYSNAAHIFLFPAQS